MAEDNGLLSRNEVEEILGNSGTSHYSGYFTEEYNATWRDQARVEIVEEMRRGDGTVKSVLNALKAPILGAEKVIEPASDDEKDLNIAEEVEEQLENMRGRSFSAFLKEALTCLEFGHAAFEKIFKIIDGKVILIDLAPRIQSSIQNWKTKDDTPGITQISRNDEGNSLELSIPMKKLFVLSYDKEGDDITGQSVLRAAYKHWMMKNTAYKVQAIGIERQAIGIPVGKYPSGAGSAEIEEFQALLKNIRANQQQYLCIAEGYEFEIVTPNGNPMGSTVKDFIDHHDRHILLSVLAVFLDLGSSSTGSFALSRDQSSFFLKHVEQFIKYVAEQITEQIVKDIVDYNYPGYGKYPKFKFTSLGEIDFSEMSEVIERLTNTGYISPNEENDMEFIRKMFKLPKKEEPTSEEGKRMEEKEEEPVNNQEDLAEKKKPEFWRELTEPEKRVDFVLLQERYDTLEKDLEDELASIVATGLESGSIRIKNLLKSGAIGALSALTFMNRAKLKASIKKAMTLAYEVGKKTASSELNVDRPSTPSKEAAIISYEADNYANQIADNLEGQAKEVAKNGYANDVAIAIILNKMLMGIKDTATNQISNISGTVVGQNINKGRRLIFGNNSGLISGYQRSEILDSKTCYMCMSLDKRIVVIDDPFAKMDLVHSNCRGSWVPLLLSEYATQKELIAQGVVGIPKTVKDQFDSIGGVPVLNSFKQLKKPVNKSNKSVQDEFKKRLE